MQTRGKQCHCRLNGCTFALPLEPAMALLAFGLHPGTPRGLLHPSPSSAYVAQDVSKTGVDGEARASTAIRSVRMILGHNIAFVELSSCKVTWIAGNDCGRTAGALTGLAARTAAFVAAALLFFLTGDLVSASSA